VEPVPTVEELRAGVIEVMHGQRHHVERCAARHGLSGQLAIALLQLESPWPAGPVAGHTASAEGDGMPMRELAGRISCDPSQVTGIADRLEDLGLVERRPARDDRRVKLLVVTDEGRRVAAELADEVNRGAPGFSALTDDERLTLRRLLARVAAATEVSAAAATEVSPADA
jgi:DNA-binding MarR family transcriptional regulator